MIHLAEPMFLGNEVAYVADALQRKQLSMGSYVARFEALFAQDVAGCTYGVATTSGTTALHLILAALGIGPGDEVILPTLTFVATANAVTYCGATPVFVDVLPNTWTIDPVKVAGQINSRTKAAIPVHLYGHPADMEALWGVCGPHDIDLVEDAAEAPGALADGKPAGHLGMAAAFSFYGNKILTTGEGGMVTTDDPRLVERMRMLRGQGQNGRTYWHELVGYNYRMTELQGALGLAQVEDFPEHLQARRRVAEWYRLFGDGPWTWQGTEDWAAPAHWMNVLVLNDGIADRDEVLLKLWERGIETRPVFYPLHTLPAYANLAKRSQRFPVAERVARQGIVLPSHAGLTADDVVEVCRGLRACLN
jgi:perosamine synthetase